MLNQTPSSFAMTVDVEDYFQVWAFSDVIARDSWDGFSLRVEDATRRILEMLDTHGRRATFFTLGWICERAPSLVREIVARGHELASHGYDHQKVFEQDREAFLSDIIRAKKILEDCAGVAVEGYRAPGFSIDHRSPWAYDALIEAGYGYSSSTHPIAHDHYGDPTAPQSPFPPVKGATFLEAPVATTTIWGRRISAAGGGWFRAAPYGVSKRLIAAADQSLGGPVIFYFHPWEVDPDQPRITSARARSRLRHYLNLNAMPGKLEKLFRDYPWTRLDETLGRRRARCDKAWAGEAPPVTQGEMSAPTDRHAAAASGHG